MRIFQLMLFLLLVGPQVHSRVFEFKDEWLAGYIRGTGTWSQLGGDAFAASSGADTFFSDKPKYHLSGEFGFVWAPTDRVAVRLGLESIMSQKLKEIDGKDAGGTILMKVDSQVSAFNPNLSLELSFISEDKQKLFMFGGAGYSMVRVSTEYGLTAAGQTLYSITDDYKESLEGLSYSGHAGVGYEVHMVDTVTALFELGYRHFILRELKHRSSVEAIGGPVSKGETARTNTGKKRKLDMGGVFLGLSFRFYMPDFSK